MSIGAPFVLPEDVQIFHASDLPPGLRSDAKPASGEYVVTRSNSRQSSSLVDAEGVALIEIFRSPRTIVDAVIEFSATRELDPQTVLGDAFPLLRQLIVSNFLVPDGSANDKPLQPMLLMGDEFAGWTVEQLAQHVEDTDVYKVRNGAGDAAALKLARPAYEAAMRDAFEREAAILSRLDIAGVPRLIEVGERDGKPFLLTQWCDGVPVLPFAQRLHHDAGGAGALRVLAISARILRGYAQLHARGIVHGDVHPNNLLVAEDQGDAVYILDFGHARVLGNAGPLGSPYRGGAAFYFDPQFAQAMLAETPPPPADPKSEQYCLAVLIRELIAGRPYLDFSIERARLLEQIVSDAPIPFVRHGLESWPAVERVLERAMAKDPERRFASLTEFADALSAVAPPKPRAAQSQPPLQLLNEVLDSVGIDGFAYKALANGQLMCSVNSGAAGVAYALYRMADLREEPTLLALADLWIAHAERRASDDAAFYSRELQVTPETVGRTSLFHSPAGLACVDALIAAALGDAARVEATVERFISRGSCESERLDFTLGRAGLLLGCVELLASLRGSPATARDALVRYGDALDSELREALAVQASPRAPSELNLGIAHGWGGVLFALLRWRDVRKRGGTDVAIESYLSDLAELAEPVGTGARWRWMAKGSPNEYMSGWCNGSAGFVHLWNLADCSLGGEKYGDLARAAGRYAFEVSSGMGDLCCGAGGRAYAMLNLYRHTGDREWLEHAHQLAGQAANLISHRAVVRDSLYKGRMGVALLIAQLEQPELSCMPLFDRDPALQ